VPPLEVAGVSSNNAYVKRGTANGKAAIPQAFRTSLRLRTEEEVVAQGITHAPIGKAICYDNATYGPTSSADERLKNVDGDSRTVGIARIDRRCLGTNELTALQTACLHQDS
jgi:hypothetical protein